MQLRYYQSEAESAAIDALKSGLNPVIQLPTGSGKSLVIASMAAKFAKKGGRLVVLTHVKELVEQNENTLKRFSPDTVTGVCCAGLNRYEPDPNITFASIQSVFKRGAEFAARGTDLIIIDEAHTVPPDGEGLMYKQFLRECNTRRLGLSATPWRLSGGTIYGEDKPFDVLSYQVPALDLVGDGYLAPLKGVETDWQLNTSLLSKVAGDYSQSKTGDLMATAGWLDAALKNALTQVKKRKHVLVFCPTVATAKEAADYLNKHGQSAEYISADSDNRDDLLSAWKAGEFKFMCNVDILTTGFDFPALDAIICLRPTQSSSLWVQMLGRGMRIADGKNDCLILDYVGNLARLGGVDTMESWSKEKKDGKMEVVQEKKKATTPKQAVKAVGLQAIDPMLGSAQGLTVNVLKCSYIVRRSARHPELSMLMAVYDCEADNGVGVGVTQFVCVEYEGGARWHAEQWAKRRGYTNPPAFPRDAHRARVECYALPTPRKLLVRRNEGHINVIKEFF